jgi:hypothetical protein
MLSLGHFAPLNRDFGATIDEANADKTHDRERCRCEMMTIAQDDVGNVLQYGTTTQQNKGIFIYEYIYIYINYDVRTTRSSLHKETRKIIHVRTVKPRSQSEYECTVYLCTGAPVVL